jgi:hypothetical protein
VIPRGELFQNQFGQEYHYIVYSQALNQNGASEASLEMHFKSRTLPLFQWAAFYDKDLEILPSPGFTLNGPVHTDADLYLGTTGDLRHHGTSHDGEVALHRPQGIEHLLEPVRSGPTTPTC